MRTGSERKEATGNRPTGSGGFQPPAGTATSSSPGQIAHFAMTGSMLPARSRSAIRRRAFAVNLSMYT